MSSKFSARPSVFRVVTITNTGGPLVAADNTRTALTLSAIDSDIFISPDAIPTVTTGLKIANIQEPVMLCQCHQGDFVKRALFGICAAGSHNIIVIEGFEPVPTAQDETMQ